VYEETLTGWPHDTSVQKLPFAMKMWMWMQFNVMPRTMITVVNRLDFQDFANIPNSG